MDPKFVNLLIQKLLNTTKCPKCGEMFSPIGLKIKQIDSNHCVFQMQCSHCDATISANAKVEEQMMNEKVEPVKSSESKEISTSPKKEKVSLEDLMGMKNLTTKFSGSFKNFF